MPETPVRSADKQTAPRRVSSLASELSGSHILNIAAEVSALAATGRAICNLTVGDFNPVEFRIPRELEDAVVAALREGQTNYPPSDGLVKLRETIRDFYERRQNYVVPLASVLVTSGARPAIYAAFRALVDPGDRVVYGVPSWNNNYYVQMIGAVPVPVPCTAATNFHPTAAMLREPLRGARLLVLNSPLNPTGTLIEPRVLGEIAEVILEENDRRARSGERPLFLVYDQVYWMLTFAGAQHANPVVQHPALADYAILVDAISKSFAATGLRVGWTTGPVDVIRRMSDIVGHVGAWAPRAEQVATASILANDAAVDTYHARMRREVQARLDALSRGLASLRAEGFPVDATAPQGAIYLSARFALHGKRTPAGEVLRTNEDIRRYLLHAAGLAAVQFQAFAAPEESGWFRLSVGAVSIAAIEALLPRVRSAVQALL